MKRMTDEEAIKRTSSRQLRFLYKKIKKASKRGRPYLEIGVKFIPTQEVMVTLHEDGFLTEITGRDEKKTYLHIEWYVPICVRNNSKNEKHEESDDYVEIDNEKEEEESDSFIDFLNEFFNFIDPDDDWWKF